VFSNRLPAAAPNALALAIERVRADGSPFIDLTVTNPTTVAIDYPADTLAALGAADALRYEPRPFGMARAREAASAEFARLGVSIAPDRIVLTASTSEAYSLLFKLLCDPGDEVLVPRPSYPLFELLSGLDAVRAVPYRLERHDDWTLDRDSLARAWSPRTRAVLVVSPNNPTGSRISDADAAWLAAECAARDVAVIADEVFADYPLAPARAGVAAGAFTRQPGVLAFTLGGLSKSAALPQVKLGWCGVSGPEALVHAALARLELIADTYLSVSTPVQMAAPALIAAGRHVRAAVQQRLEVNLGVLATVAAGAGDVTLLSPEAGWSAVLRVPATLPEEQRVIDLLEHRGVLVHPGFFFDFEHEAFLVLSLLPEPRAFAEGVARVLSA
jgi:aspartate/methionine/tyrosine aminotransferase